VALFRSAQKRGESFNNSIQFALQGVLISPQFLFRIEEPNPNPNRACERLRAGIRLSYFLWNSMPDHELVNLAAQSKLMSRGSSSNRSRG